MNQILSVPLETRLAVVFVGGLFLGCLVNWGIYRLAWNPRPISPWSPRDPVAPPRKWWDRLPVLGWLGMRREAGLHGAGFWIRPMLLELLCGVGLAVLYWWETSGGLLPSGLRNPVNLANAQVQATLHLNFAAHAILLTLMLIGSLIDVDEMIIPDEITVTGTLIGLLVAAVLPWTLLPIVFVLPGVCRLDFLNLASPCSWPAMLDGRNWIGLAVGLGCWWLWCAAIMTRTWYARHGWLRALQLSFARLRRERSTYRILRMAAIGSLAIVLVWYRGAAGAAGEPGWRGLLTALVGMAASGGLIWLVRIIGAVTLGREAMGFGDVTLMAMIGAFLGWQSCLIIFFLAPIAGLLIGVFRAILFRNREIPYGPFLCLGALVLIVKWDAFWQWTWPFFDFGWLIPAVMGACLVLMALMLGVWRLLLNLFARG